MTDSTGKDKKGGISPFLLEPQSSASGGRWIFNSCLVAAARIITAAVFIYAGFHKINSPLMFADQITMYEIISPSPLLYITAIFLPWLEIFCGLALLTGIFIRGGSFIISVLMAFFLAIIIYRTAGIMDAAGVPFTSIHFDCGCGFEPTYAWKKIIENTLLLVLSLIVFLSPSHRFILFRTAGRGGRA